MRMCAGRDGAFRDSKKGVGFFGNQFVIPCYFLEVVLAEAAEAAEAFLAGAVFRVVVVDVLAGAAGAAWPERPTWGLQELQ